METIKDEYLQDAYIGQKTAEILAIDYDENQLLAVEFSNRQHSREEGDLQDGK